MKNDDTYEYLECEKWSVFAILMFVAGFYGAYTYTIRGGVFCNAQTANFVLFAMEIGKGSLKGALYYILPMSAYLIGTIISEAIAGPVRKFSVLRWDTVLIFIEILAVIFLGLLPETAPHQIAQVTINFICSMQYNTFRQAQKIPMATTFCTNHIRQVGIAIVKAVKHRDENKPFVTRIFRHTGMLAVFVLGAIISAYLSTKFLGKAIWAALIPLGIVFVDLLYADLKTEKDRHNVVPRGH